MYYGVDFIGSSGSGNNSEKTKNDLKIKSSKIITLPKTNSEDLLIKKNKKNSKVKELVKRISERENTPQIQNPGIDTTGNNAAGSASTGLPFGSGSGGISVSNFPYAWYLLNLKNKLMTYWNEASSLSKKQVCSVMFIINRDGTLGDLKIEKSSGDNYFDQVALRAVEYAQPFPPLPDEYRENEIRVHVDFRVAQ